MSGDTGRGATTACVRLAQKVLATKGKTRLVIQIEIYPGSRFRAGLPWPQPVVFGE